jgi:hypothetical protein
VSERKVSVTSSSDSLQSSLENEAHHVGQPRPVFGFNLEMSSSFGSEIVEFGFPASLGGLPARAEQLFIFEAMERGI